MPISKRVRLSDTKSSLRKFNETSNESVISNQAISGMLNKPEAVRRLEQIGHRSGRLTAAELCLEQAAKAQNLESSSEWLCRAEDNFKRIVQEGRLSFGEKLDYISMRSLLQLAQLPLVSYMSATRSLPAPNLVDKVYKTTLEVGNELVQNFYKHLYNRNTTLEQQQQLAGVLAESGILLLGQRYAKMHMRDQSWLPMFALFSEDRANTRGSSTNHAWDISVWTDVENKQPEVTYKVQVKNSSRALEHTDMSYESSNGLCLLVAQDMLNLGYLDRNRLTCTKIISECFHEQTMGTPSVTERLDMRTSLMLDAFDA